MIFRKPDGTPFQGAAWQGTDKVDEKDGEPVRANEYFKDHPEMALGEHTLAGTMYRGNSYALVAKRGQDTMAELEKAVERLPENVLGSRSAESEIEGHDARVVASQARTARAEGAYVTGQDGKIYQVRDGVLAEPDYRSESELFPAQKKGQPPPSPKVLTDEEKAERGEVAQDYLRIREAAKALVAEENRTDSTDEELSPLRKELNDAYDSFLKKHKTLNHRARQHSPLRFFSDDPEVSLVESLEAPKQGKVRGKIAVIFEKRPIFSKRQIFPPVMPTSAANVNDALSISLGFYNRVDPAIIGKLMGKTTEEAANDLRTTDRAFENPTTGLFETREQYLSGNVRTKLKQAEEAAVANPLYARNVDALKSIQPAAITLPNIRFRLGARWIPAEVLGKYASELFQTPVTVKVGPAGGWILNWTQNTAAINTTWGTRDFKGTDLLKHALQSTAPTVTRTEGKGEDKKEVRDHAAEAIAQEKIEKMMGAFRDWVRSHQEPVALEGGTTKTVQGAVEDSFNEANNGFVEPNYDGSYLALPGLASGVKRMPHRLSIVARVLQEGYAMMAHGVGSGKTFSQIIIAHEMKRLGLANKPLIVVQKATLGQFAASYRQAYPGARLLVADEKSFSQKNRRRFMAQATTGDYEAIIVTQPQFQRLACSEETVKRYYWDRISELEMLLAEEKAKQ
ncbi:MAG: hypothetical protein ACOYMV_13700, partial [Verrucomicrobiia bacterium]